MVLEQHTVYSARKLRNAFKNWRHVKETPEPTERVPNTENKSNWGKKINHRTVPQYIIFSILI